ncbi:MAG: beta-ketoacyl synthase N-terminal-like domain-containing protein [Caulobacterales bacterium]
MRTYFLGAGLHTCLGKGVAANLAALRAPPALPSVQILPLGAEEQRVPVHLLADEPLDDIENRQMKVVDGVVREALTASGLSEADIRELAIFVGTSSLDISITEEVYQRELAAGLDAHPLTANSAMGNFTKLIRQRFGIRGPDYTVNTACTAAANALMYADAMIRAGKIKHALIIGLESFNRITALGFSSLGLLAPDGMRPFDKDRRGIALGEGCSAMVVGAEPKRENSFYLRGGANICDIFSITAANSDGSTVSGVIRDAMANAKIAKEDITAIKTHGTASLLNDEAESAGMKQVFEKMPPLCAIKPFIGHTFGACGLNELILFCGALEEGFLIATPGIGADENELGVVLTQERTPVAPGVFMLNYFGFGGNNTSLVIANAG